MIIKHMAGGGVAFYNHIHSSSRRESVLAQSFMYKAVISRFPTVPRVTTYSRYIYYSSRLRIAIIVSVNKN